MKRFTISILLILSTISLSFAAPLSSGKWETNVAVTGQIDGFLGSNSMMVYLPAGYDDRGTKKYPLVIALHGWDHSPELWKKKGDLGVFADQFGFVLAVPNMGRTIYETGFYPETRGQWKTAPGSRWVGEVVLPLMRKQYAVFGDRAHTAIIGYSTGGRGAVLVAELYPEFAFVGSLSGTFDLMRLKPTEGEYRIHEIIYGPRVKFLNRWNKDNCVNPSLLSKLNGSVLFIGHGSADKSVNPNQLDALRDALKDTSIDARFVVVPSAIHDWSYWNSQWQTMFEAMFAVINR